jgi:ActR/RegA family two-component response regulator
MAINGNVLLVEDEDSWSGVYERAAQRAGFETIEGKKTYDAAASAIDSKRFAVAVVDIGLRVDDDRNVDGLRVMEKIRAVGDRTGIIVVTGRTGADVLPIIRDSIKKFNAYDTIAKATLLPAELRALIVGARQEYERGAAEDKAQLYDALRGDMKQVFWDDTLLGKAVTLGGAAELYRLIESLFGPFVPLLPGKPGGVRVQDDNNLAFGTFWSRGVGAAIVSCFGDPDRVAAAVEAVNEDGMLGRYPVAGESVGEYSSPNARGVIYRLQRQERSDFT